MLIQVMDPGDCTFRVAREEFVHVPAVHGVLHEHRAEFTCKDQLAHKQSQESRHTVFNVPLVKFCGKFFSELFDVRLNPDGMWVCLRWIHSIFMTERC